MAADARTLLDADATARIVRRLTAEMAPTSVTQLVMWHLASKLNWDTISELSRGWANDYEMTLAQDFVKHLDALPSGETGQLLFELQTKDASCAPIAGKRRCPMSGRGKSASSSTRPFWAVKATSTSFRAVKWRSG